MKTRKGCPCYNLFLYHRWVFYEDQSDATAWSTISKYQPFLMGINALPTCVV